MFFSKEMSRLIAKGLSNIYNWEKLTFSKLVWKVNLSEGTFEEMRWLWRAKKVQGVFGETFILTLLSSAVFRLQNHGDWDWEMSLNHRKWDWFQGNKRFPKYLG